ncbi:MAG TPA: hypothetical protein VNH11_33855 [Pirellulales bacterium]|nr:hypothetical protein [Pirellulales bacterium]
MIKQLAENDPAVRASASDELGRLQSRDAIEPLIKLLSDYRSLDQSNVAAERQWQEGWRPSRHWVGAHAAKALSQITGRPLETDHARWHSWWWDHREELREPDAAARLFVDESKQRLAKVKERWKLRLMPDNVPDTGPALIGMAWREQGRPTDILGRGVAQFMRFPFPRQQGGNQLTIALSTLRSHGARSPIISTEAITTYWLTLEGPFFVYDELLHTGFVSGDGKLIPDALLRVGDGKWYIASARRLDDAKAADCGRMRDFRQAAL